LENDMTSTFADPTLNDVAGLETSTTPDAAILAAIVRGERHALESLYLRHAPWLIARLSRRCSDAGLDSHGEVAAWIWGIAIRRMIDALRRRPVRTLPLNDLLDGESTVEASAEDQAIALPNWWIAARRWPSNSTCWNARTAA
jgi:DNA-directed RNA polymerase specialized sigma24 family protein